MKYKTISFRIPSELADIANMHKEYINSELIKIVHKIEEQEQEKKWEKLWEEAKKDPFTDLYEWTEGSLSDVSKSLKKQ